MDAVPGLRCNCIHIDGVWCSRTQYACAIHPCSLCLMRAGEHIGHFHIQGRTVLAPEYLYDI